MHSNSIHSKIREARENNNETQEDIANAVNVSRQTIIAIEKGDCTPSVAIALRIAKHLKKTVEELFNCD